MTRPDYDIWCDFNEIWTDNTVVTYADFARPGVSLTVGSKLTAGDDDGNRCPATVAEEGGPRIVLKLDMEQFQPALNAANAEATP